MLTVITILQLMCLALCGYGLYFEYTHGAPLGYLLITLGSVIFAVTTKLNKIRLSRHVKQLKQHHEKATA